MASTRFLRRSGRARARSLVSIRLSRPSPSARTVRTAAVGIRRGAKRRAAERMVSCGGRNPSQTTGAQVAPPTQCPSGCLACAQFGPQPRSASSGTPSSTACSICPFTQRCGLLDAARGDLEDELVVDRSSMRQLSSGARGAPSPPGSSPSLKTSLALPWIGAFSACGRPSVAHARVRRLELGDVAAPAEQRLGEPLDGRLSHLPIEVVVYLREAREVGVDELLRLVGRDVHPRGETEGVHPVGEPVVHDLRAVRSAGSILASGNPKILAAVAVWMSCAGRRTPSAAPRRPRGARGSAARSASSRRRVAAGLRAGDERPRIWRAELGPHRDVLQVRVERRQPAGRRHGLVERRVDAARRGVDLPGQRLEIGRVQLVELAPRRAAHRRSGAGRGASRARSHPSKAALSASACPATAGASRRGSSVAAAASSG